MKDDDSTSVPFGSVFLHSEHRRCFMRCEQHTSEINASCKCCSQAETCSTSEGTCSDSEDELSGTASAGQLVGSIIEDAVGAFSDELSDDVPEFVELLCPPVRELEGDTYDSEDEFVDVEDESGGEEEVEAKRGAVFVMLPACVQIPACTATPFQRRFVPQLGGPGVPAMPFPADSLPPSPPVAKSMPPEAELGRTLPSRDMSDEAKGMTMYRAEKAFQFLAARAREEAARLIQVQWRFGRQASLLRKQKALLWSAHSEEPAPCEPGVLKAPCLFDGEVVSSALRNVVPPTTPKTGVPPRRLSCIQAVPTAFSSAVPDQPEDQGIVSPTSSRRRQARHKVIAPEFFVRAAGESVPSVTLAPTTRKSRTCQGARRSGLPSIDHAPKAEPGNVEVICLDLDDALFETSGQSSKNYEASGTELMDTVCSKVLASPSLGGDSGRELSSEFRTETDVASPRRRQVFGGMSSPKAVDSGRSMRSNRVATVGDATSGAQKLVSVAGKEEPISPKLAPNKKTWRANTTPSAMELDIGVTAVTSSVRPLAQDQTLSKIGRTKASVGTSRVVLPQLSSARSAVLWGGSTAWHR